MKSELLNSFFVSNDKKTLYRIVQQLNKYLAVVDVYEGLKPVSRRIEPMAKLTGLSLYDSLEAAIASEMESGK